MKKAAENGFCWPAPAKLNLCLHVNGRRPDGFHEVQTLYQLLDWGDFLSVAAADGGEVRRTTRHAQIPADQDLAVRAAKLLRTHCGIRQGARIGVRKNIPLGAGLGGGSSDAATVLLALNEVWNCGLSLVELAELGLQLGADVPLFVRGRSAWGEGIGERLTPCALGERFYVLVFPGVHVSTRAVFDDPLLPRDTPGMPAGDFTLAGSRNDCTEVVSRRYPAIGTALEELGGYGRPRLTGTGSCIFLPAADKKSADSITSRLKSRYNVRAVRGIDRSPTHGMLRGTQ